MAAQPTPWISVEDYLNADRAAEFRSEYFDGEVFPISSGTTSHGALIIRLGSELLTALEDRGCSVQTVVRLQVSPTGLYTYPDLMVVCGPPAHADNHRDTILNPVLIVEVLSPSTEGYDRGRKFEQYQLIPSVQYYILASQDKPRLELFTRQPNPSWTYIAAQGPAATLDLPTLNCRLDLDRIYRNVPGIDEAK